jgi:hypothetical protein
MNNTSNPTIAATALSPDSTILDPNACALCGHQKSLRKSHIVPKFWFKVVKDGAQRMHQVSANHSPMPPYIQDGPKTPLLCEDCESLLNETYEKNFIEVWHTNPVYPTPLPEDLFAIDVGDYARFKLFHLSVLWRAGLAALRESTKLGLSPWSAVHLGKHEPRLRKMLLTADPGEDDEYAVCGLFLTLPNKPQQFEPRFFMNPDRRNYDGMEMVSFYFAGMWWWYVVENHCSSFVRPIKLDSGGTMPVKTMCVTDLQRMSEIFKDDTGRRGFRKKLE